MVKKGELNISIGTILVMLLTFILSLFGYQENSDNSFENKNSNQINSENKIVQELSNENLELYFCPQQNCHKQFYDELNSAETTINCALHEFDDLNMSNLLSKKQNEGIKVNLIIEENYLDEHGLDPIKENKNINFKTDSGSKLMHHKFCVIDDKTTITGSMNPTPNGFFKNNNNLIIIHSSQLAKNYNQEFTENLLQNKFQKKKTNFDFPKLNLTTPNESFLIDVEMCPSKQCLSKTLNILNKSKSEILFANFVLTENQIEKLLVDKSNNNITVKGVVENRLKNVRGTMIQELNESFPISIDKNKNTMHHKFFVVDETYVITGSMNPSASGTNGNDENLIIIENKALALEFKQEFNELNS